MRTTLIATRALLLLTVATSIAAGCSSSGPARTDGGTGTGGTSTGGAGGTHGNAGSGGSVGPGGSGGTGGMPADAGADAAPGNAFVYFVKQANGTTTATLASGAFSVNSTYGASGNGFKYVAPNYYGTVSNGFISFPTPMTGDFSITAQVTVTPAAGTQLQLSVPGFFSPAQALTQARVSYLEQFAVYDPPATAGAAAGAPRVVADYSAISGTG